MSDEKFLKRLEKLNDDQRKAVEEIFGPILVIAGPGSGKTELLAIRVANILRETDTIPSSILCLTFTDAAASNMRKRIAGLIGNEAYKVSVHTFHSFGSEIINQNPEFFYSGAKVEAVDELTRVEIIEDILESMNHDAELNSYHPSQGYTFLSDIKSKIGQLKESGLLVSEFREIILENDNFFKKANLIINEVFSDRISKKILEILPRLIQELSQIDGNSERSNIKNYPKASESILQSLTQAVNESLSTKKTKAISTWKTKFLKKNAEGQIVLKDSTNIKKMLELADVYEKYNEILVEKGLFDFSDMILDTARALEKNSELRFNIQEKYQFVMVDEFQDTSGVQMRLLDNILNLEITDGRPNILAVGDDDQSIYKFQGAKIANILSFHKKFKDPNLIVLTKNYRSSQEVLNSVRKLVSEGEERLENVLPEINKTLVASNPSIKTGEIQLNSFFSRLEEFSWIADKINQLKNEGKKLNEIAVLTRKHKDLEQLALLLDHMGIKVNYERKKNILELKPIKELVILFKFINSIATKGEKEADHFLPEILASEFWQLNKIKIWKTSVDAYRGEKIWLKTMLESEDEELANLANFLIHLGILAKEDSAEEIIDYITGVKDLEFENEVKYRSPFKEYYFSEEKLKSNLSEYLEYLSAVRTLITKLRSYKKGTIIYIKDLVEFLELHEKHNLKIFDKSSIVEDEDSVNLITAHSSKGLEFDTVFVSCLDDKRWSSHGKNDGISFPINMPLSPSSETPDDVLRLFYVALTRTKSNLFLTLHSKTDEGRELIKFRFLGSLGIEEQEVKHHTVSKDYIELSLDFLKKNTFEENETQLLKEILAKFSLSVTHLNNFLNIEKGGPQYFLEQNLLRFPQKPSIHSDYGSSVHEAIDQFHKISKNRKKVAELSILQEKFEEELKKRVHKKEELKKYTQKGYDELKEFYEQHLKNVNFKDYSEFDFRGQNIILDGEAKITGKVDRIDIDNEKKEVYVIDYKTGKPIEQWHGGSKEEKIKKWQYRNQLIFYKLLLENSSTFGGKLNIKTAGLEFVKTNKAGKICILKLEVEDRELKRMEKLIIAVWKKIMDFDLPDINDYSKDIDGILKFENDLLDGII